MKCAMELMVTATVKAEENARIEAERIRRAKEIKRKITVEFCEKLGAQLEDKAQRGVKPEVEFRCDKWGHPLTATTRQYADRRTSYIPDGSSLDLEFLVEWFDKYCFTVSSKEFPAADIAAADFLRPVPISAAETAKLFATNRK